ncbi:MAG: glycine--tRNA ligase subunit beta, partial [Alphaproteobacteria bacterium]
KTEYVLKDVLGSTLNRFPWPKSMKWAEYDLLWVRPLHNVLAIFDGKEIPFSIALKSRNGRRSWGESKDNLYDSEFPLTANNKTTGHRFLAPDEFAVKDFADYRDRLRDAYVMLDAAERRRVIEQDAALKAGAEGLTLRPDPGLVAENAGMVEWPVVLTGRIDPAFMELPAEVLTTVMRHHLKHFALLDKDGNLAPRFLVVANIQAGDGGKQIVAGNERVLRARLADAKFFWDHDRKRTLEDRLAALEGLIFHQKLGNLLQKSARVSRLSNEICRHAARQLALEAERAGLLCKCDLVTHMVGEFPELQGIMGAYYAADEDKQRGIHTAIREHYLPLGPKDKCPSTAVGSAVALADKVDTLVGFFAIGEKPTGSKDPFALRRAGLGILRIILENEFRLFLAEILTLSFSIYSWGTDTQSNEDWVDVGARAHVPMAGYYHDRTVIKRGREIAGEVLAFLTDRLKVHLRERGVRHDLISAVFALSGEDDLVRLLARIEALSEFLKGEDGEHLLTAYRRASNIVRIEEKKDGRRYNGPPKSEYFRQNEEKHLHRSLRAAARASSKALDNDDFSGAMSELSKLRGPVDRFFSEVTVNCEKRRLRANRLRLLSEIRATLDHIADFSRIEGGER